MSSRRLGCGDFHADDDHRSRQRSAHHQRRRAGGDRHRSAHAADQRRFRGANGVICNVDAKLEGLADNGGTAQTYTHALRPGSPALDAGNNAGAPPFDQRGTPFARIVNNTIDIGAFESPVLNAALPCKLDMNGDNQLSALSEGIVLLRAMFGMTGTSVVNRTGITQGQWDAVRNNLNANCGTSFAP